MERDDIIEYSLDSHHSEEEGKKLRRKIWLVTGILTAITALEVFIGAVIHQDHSMWQVVKWGFIIATLFKAAFIVLSFMHLGDERKSLKWVILAPYALFIIYLIFIAITEAVAVNATLEVN